MTPQPVPRVAIGEASERDPAALGAHRYPLGECELPSEEHLIPKKRVAEFLLLTRRCGSKILSDFVLIGEPRRRRYLTRVGVPRKESSVIQVQ